MKNKWIYWCGLAILVFFCLPATAWAETEGVGVAYRGHIQNIGDYPLDGTWVNSPEPIGTVGQSKRIEGFEIRLEGQLPAGLELRYNVHVQNKGWLYDEDDPRDWPKDGAYAGTRGEGLRIEAVKLVLTDADGQLYPGYSVQYRGHVQNVGDLPAAAADCYADGQQLGTVGSSLRLEALLVTVVKKETDLTAYKALLAQIDKMTAADYTVSSWTALQTALDSQVVTADQPQLAVNAAVDAIQSACDGLVKKASPQRYDTAGTYGPAEGSQTLAGDVVVAADGVILNNLVIEGSLTIAETVGDGNVTLNNITVKGDTLVRGGGVNSIHINGGQYGRIIMEKTASGGVRIVAVDAAGLKVVITEAAAGKTIILEGAFESVTVNAPNMTVTTQGTTTTIGKMTVSAGAAGSTVTVAAGTTVTDLVLDGKAAVKGQGNVAKAEVNADGVVFDKKPGAVTVEPGVVIPPVFPTPDSGGNGGGYTPPTPIAVTAVSLNKTALNLSLNAAETLAATVAPADAANKAVSWTSSDDSVAMVDSDGTVTGITKGTATITVTTQDGGKTAICMVTVNDLIKSITGLTVPFHGDQPDVEIDATNQYTGAVTWREQGGSVDLQDTDHFDGAKTYVATITLSMIAPYTVADIDANCFTVAGATTTNGANTAVVTAVFAPVEQYRIDNTGLITAYSGPGGELVIPDSIFNSTNVETTVTGIGERVFYDRGLTRVTLPGAVNIADAAFSGDPLTKITIGNNATISNVADTMGVYGSAFYAYYESSVAGKPARSPGQYVYESGVWQFDNGLSFSGATITAYDKTKGSYVFIPKTGAGIDITAIADGDNLTGVFSDGSLKTLTFASDSQLTTIGSLAFAQNQLASLSLPDTVETIGYAAFYDNQQLKNATLSSGLKTIDYSAFHACGLETLTLPNDLETIGASAFAVNNLAGMLTIPASVTDIDASAFGNNAITSLVIEETAGTPSTLMIKCGAFKAYDASRNPITRITIPAGVLIKDDDDATTMGYYGANFKAAYTAGGAGIYNYDSGTDSWIKETIPVGVTAPFNGVAPNTDITTDAQGRFTGEVSWTETSTNTAVAGNFDGTKAYTATIKLTPKGSYSFPAGTNFAVDGADTVSTTIGTNGLTATVTATYGVKDRYAIDGNGVITAYSGPGGELVVPGTIGTIAVKGIGDSVFKDNESLTKVTLPANVTAIGDFAFNNCISLANLSFAANSQLATIGESAFFGCALTDLTLPANVTSIGSRAFHDCTSLKNFTFETGSQLGTIGGNAFNYCMALTTLTLPATVTAIGNDAFYGCNHLGALTFAVNSQLATIGERAFCGCALTDLTLPANVTAIGQSAFANNKLTQLTLSNPDGSTVSIGVVAFRGGPRVPEYNQLTEITLPANVSLPVDPQADIATMGLYGAAFKIFYESTETDGNKSAGGTFVYNVTNGTWSKNP